MSKLKLAVIMGGVSSEREVSIMSGNEIIKNLDRSKYLIHKVVIQKNGRGLTKLAKIKPDVVFIALHGKGGEDGTIQGYLESLNIPYTGSGVLASAIGMNKIIFRNLMKVNKIDIPESVSITKGVRKIKPSFTPPYFVKPFDGGSSVWVSFVETKRDLNKSIKFALKYSDMALIDKFIDGLEVNCGVIGNDSPIALPPIEIHPLAGKFFDYKSKYTAGGSEEIVPAKISKSLTKKIKDLSVRIYKIVGCKGYARIDYILENNKKPIVLEINTLPGMTINSLLPKEAKATGISYSELLDKIIRYANER